MMLLHLRTQTEAVQKRVYPSQQQWGCALCSLEDAVCVQVDAGHIGRGVVQVEVAGVDSHNEGTGGAQNVCQGQGAEGNIGARPVKGENHLRRKR